MASRMLVGTELCPHDLAIDVDGYLGDRRPLQGRIRRLCQLHPGEQHGLGDVFDQRAEPFAA